MLNCKAATRLMSQAQDRPLSLSEKMQLEMHLLLCTGCQNFRSQLSFLREACKRYGKGGEE